VSAGLSVKEENILTLKLKLTLFFLGVKEENILTLKLKLTLFFVGLSTNASLWPFLHAQAQTHSVFFGCEGRKYPHTQTQTHSVFFGCEGGKYPHTHTQTHTVFMGVEEQNILTLKPTLTLFFFPSTQSLPIRLGGEATLRFGVQFSLVKKYFLFPHNLAVIHKIHH
jgi:hypothetical protein